MYITIEAPATVKALFEEYETSTGYKVDYVTVDDLMGGEVMSFILALTAATAPCIAKILIQMLKSKNGSVSINYNGKKISNITEETAERIFEKLLEQDAKNGNS